MIKYKLVCLDVFGTILALDDGDCELPPRKGINKFIENCRKNNVNVTITTDAPLTTTKIHLEEYGIETGLIDSFYQLNELPFKDFSKVLRDFKIKKPNLAVVIGDSYDKDIRGAMEYGCSFLQVPEYYNHLDNFDFSKIKI